MSYEPFPALPVDFDPRTVPSISGFGCTNDGMYPFFPAMPCYSCGRFVGRNGYFGVETFEMSNEIASAEGQCRSCLEAETSQEPPA